jgi:hypothetical protein
MRFGLLVALLALTGCEGDDVSTPAGPSLIFETDVRANYTPVRSCRRPGEHSGLNAYTVWVNETARSSFSAIWETPPAATELAAGAIVVKEVYSSPDCDPATVERWVAMEKRPGFDPAHSDWYWQEVLADRSVSADGADMQCLQCHTGDDASCAGYGNTAGRDYLCTAPP